jgi:predicted XRE-type DNA-binding protein
MAPATAAKNTILSIRRDIALQVSKIAGRFGGTQIESARRLGIPQPTLSKINNGRVDDLSIELLLRVAIQAGLELTLQTGRNSQEAGAFISGIGRSASSPNESKVAQEARKSLQTAGTHLTPAELLEAFLQHNQLLAALHQAGRAAERRRLNKPPHVA